MGAWAYVVAYLAAFVLLQLVVYRYLRDRDGEGTGLAFVGPPNTDPGPGGDGDQGTVGEPVEAAGSEETDVRRCPACGETNDPDGPYTFCRNCASRLPG